MPLDSNKQTYFDLDKTYDRFRERISREDELINQRTTWFVTFEAFLFTSFAFLVGKFAGIQFELLSSCLGFVGISVATTTFVSVRAAQCAINSLKLKWETLTKDMRKDHLPPLVGSGSNKRVRMRGSTSSVCLPIAISFGWLMVLAIIWSEEDAIDRLILNVDEIVEEANESIINAIPPKLPQLIPKLDLEFDDQLAPAP